MRGTVILNGVMYEIGQLGSTFEGVNYLSCGGNGTMPAAVSSGVQRYPIRRIPDDDPRVIAYKLGKVVCAEIPSEVMARANGDIRPTNGVEPHYDFRCKKVYEHCPDNEPVIILSEPAPEPKTAEELLADIIAARNDAAYLSGESNLTDALDAGEKYLTTE